MSTQRYRGQGEYRAEGDIQVHEIAKEVSCMKEQSDANFAVFCRLHTSLRSCHIPSVWAVDAEPCCLVLGDILAQVPLSPAHIVKLLHPRTPVSVASIVCYVMVPFYFLILALKIFPRL